MENIRRHVANPSGTYQIGNTIFKPLVVGAKIRKLMQCKYEWNVYLKPFGNENYSVFIREVVLKYKNAQGEEQRKVLQNMPYETTYVGHKNTKLTITVILRDEGENIAHMQHCLSVEYATLLQKSPRELVCERCGFIDVFQPSKQFSELLLKNQPMEDDSWKHFTNLDAEKRYIMKNLASSYNGFQMLCDPTMYNRFVLPHHDAENEENH